MHYATHFKMFYVRVVQSEDERTLILGELGERDFDSERLRDNNFYFSLGSTASLKPSPNRL